MDIVQKLFAVRAPPPDRLDPLFMILAHRPDVRPQHPDPALRMRTT